MKRELIGILLFILIVTSISIAYTFNEKLTTKNFLERNPNTENICYYVDWGEDKDDIIFHFNCVDVQRTGTNEYSALSNKAAIRYIKKDFDSCVLIKGIDRCINENVKPKVLAEIRNRVTAIRKQIIIEQQNAKERDTRIENKINFTTLEINS